MEWHRLFGLVLTDFFAGSPFAVEVERDLSVQQQRLDVLVARKGQGHFVGRLPDGLNDLYVPQPVHLQVPSAAFGPLGPDGIDWPLRQLSQVRQSVND